MKNETLHMPGEWEKEQARQRSDEFLIPVGTRWLRADVLGVCAEIRRLWPELDVVKCNYEGHDCMALGHWPYMVMEVTRTGKQYPVLGVEKLDNSVVKRLWAMHESQVHAEAILRGNRRALERQHQKTMDVGREGLEVVESALRSHKFEGWKGPGGKKLGEYGRDKRRDEK